MPDEPLSTAWPIAPTPCPLPHAHVHVYRVALDRPDAEVRALSAVLSPDEIARASRQRRPRDGARWAVARAALRHVLAAAVGAEPASLAFVVDDLGKPHLTAGCAQDDAADLAFNLSHSDGLALIALARGCRVGVDLEAVGGRNDLAAIAARYFSPRERAYLAGLAPEAWNDAFFVLWTAKEAYTKAIGAGLSAGFGGFDIVVGADGGLTVAGDAGWSLHPLAPGSDHHGALAVDVPDVRLRTWGWRAERSG